MSEAIPRTRSRRFVVLSTGLVAILAGVAIAFFLTDQPFAGNQAEGGNLVVTSSLDEAPLVFTGQQLFPTNEGGGGEAAIEDQFSVANDNPVGVRYEISAISGTVNPDDSVTADTAEGEEQFADLMIEITEQQAAPAPSPLDPVLGEDPPPPPAPVYSGPLSELSDQALGEFATSASKTYDVKLWLADDGTNQPQGITSVWTFFISAVTPVDADTDAPAPDPAP